MRQAMEEDRKTTQITTADEIKWARFLERQENYDQWFPYWRQSPRARNQTFATWRNRHGTQKAWQQAQAFVDSFDDELSAGLLLAGPTGTGKTHLLRAITHALTDRGTPVLGSDTVQWLSRIQQTYGTGGVSEADLFRAVRSAPLVVFDDLGAERVTEWSLDRLYSLIETRYDSMRPVLVSTNYDLDELSDRVGMRLTSRLIEMCTVQAVAAEDFRHTQNPAKSIQGQAAEPLNDDR